MNKLIFKLTSSNSFSLEMVRDSKREIKSFNKQLLPQHPATQIRVISLL